LTGIADRWRHSRGRAGTELLAPLVDEETLCFLCGPPSMITDVPEILRSLGVPQKRIRTEEY
jgi:ferredoxin-NADP reductase